jgi:hypothetical protein
MQFDPQKLNQELEPRTADVVVNELKALYDPAPDEDLIFTVRGLNGNDLVAVSSKRDTNTFVEMLSEALIKKNGKEGGEAIKGLLGLFDDELHPELKYRVELIVRASLEPKIDYPLAVKLAREFYVVLHRLSEKILELSGLGAQLKKKSSSDSITIPSS